MTRRREAAQRAMERAESERRAGCQKRRQACLTMENSPKARRLRYDPP